MNPLNFLLPKSTRQLSQLNKIWEGFNNGEDPDIVLSNLSNITWKYHKEKVELLEKFCYIKKQMNNTDER